MELNIPKIFKIELYHVIEYIEKIIADKLKYFMYNSFNYTRLTIEDITYKIIGIKHDPSKKPLIAYQKAILRFFYLKKI